MYQDGFWKHGRFYGSWKPGKYVFPIDSVQWHRTQHDNPELTTPQEELNRLDLFHKVFQVARNEKDYTYALNTLDRTPRILDLGTGTGIWAISVAEK